MEGHCQLAEACKRNDRCLTVKESIMMNDKERSARQLSEQNEVDAAVAAYLKKGGEVTVCEPNARTEGIQVGQWGRKGKKKPPTPAD